MTTKESILIKEDTEGNALKVEESGKRGTRIYYSLTEQAKKRHQLKILGIGDKFEKRRDIYHLLLYYDLFKRSNLITKSQLKSLLKKANISFDNIGNTEEEDKAHMGKCNTFLKDSNIGVKILGYPKGIAIGEVFKKGNLKGKKYARYYVVIPGFTLEEFITYIDKLKKNKVPRPFTDIIPIIPYIHYKHYEEDEIIESIKLLHEAGLLNKVISIFNEEERYVIAGTQLTYLFYEILIIHRIQYELIMQKILYINKPDDDDKNLLNYFFGEHLSNLIIAHAYEFRKTFQNDDKNNNRIKDIKNNIRELEADRDAMLAELKETYGDIVKSNSLLRSLIM